MSIYIVDAGERAKRCTFLGRRLNYIAKDMLTKTRANVAVFAMSDQGRSYHYASPETGVEAVMNRVGFIRLELNVIEKLRRDSQGLKLHESSLVELMALENQFMMTLEGIQVAELNLGLGD